MAMPETTKVMVKKIAGYPKKVIGTVISPTNITWREFFGNHGVEWQQSEVAKFRVKSKKAQVFLDSRLSESLKEYKSKTMMTVSVEFVVRPRKPKVVLKINRGPRTGLRSDSPNVAEEDLSNCSSEMPPPEFAKFAATSDIALKEEFIARVQLGPAKMIRGMLNDINGLRASGSTDRYMRWSHEAPHVAATLIGLFAGLE